MSAHEEVDIKDGVRRCPNGCDFDDLEIGTEGESFLAILGNPYKRIHCGACGFLGDPAVGKDAAIEEWNKKVSETVALAHQPCKED